MWVVWSCLGEDHAVIGEGFEFQSVSARVEQEECSLLARFALEANMRLNQKLYISLTQLVGNFPPFSER